MLNVVMLNVVKLNVVMLYVVMLNVVMLNVIMLNVIMLNVVMLNVVMLSAVGWFIFIQFCIAKIADAYTQKGRKSTFLNFKFGGTFGCSYKSL